MSSRRGRRIAILAACAAALLLSTAAGAEAPPAVTSFPDRVGDAGRGFDISALNVWEADGYLEFQVKTPRQVDVAEDGPLIALDLDQNPDTGSAFFGTEIEIAMEGEGNARDASAVLYRSNGWDFRRVTPPEGWGWGGGPNEVDFFISRAQLGISPTAGFNVVAASAASHPDTAPDIGTFNYQVVPGTPAPPLGPDRRAPHVSVYPAKAVHGRLSTLRYWVLDGRGKTAETIRIYRGRRLLKTIHRPLRASNPFDLSRVGWRVPAGVRGHLRFSVRAADAAGNTSELRWAAVMIR